MHIALVDADSIYFRVACTTSKEKEIKSYIDRTLDDIMAKTFSTDMKIAVKGRGNYRHDLYAPYKSHRPDLDPKVREALNIGHKYMVDSLDAVMANGMEADDLCSIWARECRDDDISYSIAGIDKDLLQIEGSHYNFTKKVNSFIEPDEGHKLLMLQCLTGDNADNIPGIKGIGPKKAAGILKATKMDRRWGRVKAAWRGKSAGDPTVSRVLLSMLTSFDELDTIQYKLSQGVDPKVICKEFIDARDS